jgi:hypothetical protein
LHSFVVGPWNRADANFSKFSLAFGPSLYHVAFREKLLMAKYRTPKHVRDGRREGKLSTKEKKRASTQRWNSVMGFGKRSLSALSVILSIFGLWTLIAYFLPQVSVNATDPLSDDPFSAPFIVENSGNFPLSSVQASCEITKMRSAGNVEENNATITNYMIPIPNLKSKDKSSVFCKNNLMRWTPPISADAIVQISYHPVLTPWVVRKLRFRFRTVQSSDSKVHWIPLSLSDPN